MDITNFIRNGITYPIGDTKSRESIAAAFDSTVSYSTGDYVMYDGILYKFISFHSGDWDSTHAEATCVTNELGSGGGGGNSIAFNGDTAVITVGGVNLPTGGTTGQVLVKQSSTDGDVGWYTPGHYPVDKWYLTDGVSESDTLAAYQFVDRESEADALINLNNSSSNNLTKNDSSVTWNVNTGFYFPTGEGGKGLVNDTVKDQYLTAIAYVNAVDTSQDCGLFMKPSKRFSLCGQYYNGSAYTVKRPYMAIESDSGIGAVGFNRKVNGGALNSTYDGVVAWLYNSNKAFYNKQEISLTQITVDYWYTARIASSPLLIGTPYGYYGGSSSHAYNFYVLFASFYNIELSASQINDITDKINSVLGASS